MILSMCLPHLPGGSTVIQRREEGSVDFDQTWEKYEKGFGDLESEIDLFLSISTFCQLCRETVNT